MALTLVDKRNRADEFIMSLWGTVAGIETAYYKRNRAFKSFRLRKLHLPSESKWDVYARVVTSDDGFALQVLVTDGATQYARSKGYGTVNEFDWKIVDVGQLDEVVSHGPPMSFAIGVSESVTF